jgi:predicted glutamine amidotransferase
MCRLVGLVAAAATSFRTLLKDAPRSLGELSREHRDGWGVGVWGGDAWRVHKSVHCAAEDPTYAAHAQQHQGAVLVAHVRQKTVGPTRLENTHPFVRGHWLFAHNGTVKDVPYLRRGTAKHFLDMVQGDTDSEVLFSYLLTRLADAGATHAGPSAERVLRTACAELRSVPDLGAFNFLLSDGRSLYAHRFGRTMFTLERGPAPKDESGVRLRTQDRAHAVCVASERITDESWEEIPDGTFMTIDGGAIPRRRLAA